LRWQARQLTQLQRQCAAVLLANHAPLARLDESAAVVARSAKKKAKG
jgi:hypothetical protein